MSENRTKTDGYMLRFPDGMRERLKEAAEANNRSMNAEIIARLQGSTDELRDRLAMSAVPALFNELYQQSRSQGKKFDNGYIIVAKAAYEFADTMLWHRATPALYEPSDGEGR